MINDHVDHHEIGLCGGALPNVYPPDASRLDAASDASHHGNGRDTDHPHNVYDSSSDFLVNHALADICPLG